MKFFPRFHLLAFFKCHIYFHNIIMLQATHAAFLYNKLSINVPRFLSISVDDLVKFIDRVGCGQFLHEASRKKSVPSIFPVVYCNYQ